MSDDVCVDDAGWSIVAAATPFSTLAGVLAGFLIVAATALIVQWHERHAPHTIALFASGVPALVLSSYVFSVVSGAKLTDEPARNVKICNQLWSQWVSAIAMLLIGGSVLICGLAWALVNYGEEHAVRLLVKKRSMQTVEDRRRYFIKLNAWLSVSATTATAALVIAANVLYLKASGKDMTFFRWRDVEWYAILVVFLQGFYVMVRSAFLVITRGCSAKREILRSCRDYRVYSWSEPRTAHYSGGPTDGDVSRSCRAVKCRACAILGAIVFGLAGFLASYVTDSTEKENISDDATCSTILILVAIYATLGLLAWLFASRSRSSKNPAETQACIDAVAKEICIGTAIGLFALLAVYFTDETENQHFSAHMARHIVIAVLLAYAILQLLYLSITIITQYKTVAFSIGISPMVKLAKTTYEELDQKIGVTSAINTNGPESIRVKYDLGRLPATPFHVICWAIFGTVFAAVLTQGPLVPDWRIGLSLFVGGLYPAGILLGLSYSVPAGPNMKVPPWRNWRWLRIFLP